jgi:hypothetical protein
VHPGKWDLGVAIRLAPAESPRTVGSCRDFIPLGLGQLGAATIAEHGTRAHGSNGFPAILRARAGLLAISEALTEHAT